MCIYYVYIYIHIMYVYIYMICVYIYIYICYVLYIIYMYKNRYLSKRVPCRPAKPSLVCQGAAESNKPQQLREMTRWGPCPSESQAVIGQDSPQQQTKAKNLRIAQRIRRFKRYQKHSLSIEAAQGLLQLRIRGIGAGVQHFHE